MLSASMGTPVSSNFRKPDKPGGKLTAQEKRAQAALIMQRRLSGQLSVPQLSAEFGISPRTVDRRLALARQDGVPDAAREIFIADMLPKSMAVLDAALDGEDMKLAVQVALKVVEGLKAMELPQEADKHDGAVETLEFWRAKLTRRSEPGAGGDAPSASPPPPPTGGGPARPVPALGGWRDEAAAAPIEAEIVTGSGPERGRRGHDADAAPAGETR